MASILHNRESVTQGDSLTMIVYGIGILPLIKNLKQEIPDVKHPWYTDGTGALGTLSILQIYFDSLARQGPGPGYHPKPTKSVLIVHPENIKKRKEFAACLGFKVCTGARYLGGFIGDDESKCNWLRECKLTW